MFFPRTQKRSHAHKALRVTKHHPKPSFQREGITEEKNVNESNQIFNTELFNDKQDDNQHDTELFSIDDNHNSDDSDIEVENNEDNGIDVENNGHNGVDIDKEDSLGQDIDINDIPDFDFDGGNVSQTAFSGLEGNAQQQDSDLAQVLTDLGIYKYMHVTCKRTLTHTKTLVGRVCDFLSWTYKRKHNNVDLDDTRLKEWLTIFVKSGYALLFSYVDYLVEVKSFQSSTVLSYLDDIKAAVTWFVLFSEDSGCSTSDVNGVHQTIHALRRIQSKQVNT